jgi:hypothetical protein
MGDGLVQVFTLILGRARDGNERARGELITLVVTVERDCRLARHGYAANSSARTDDPRALAPH